MSPSPITVRLLGAGDAAVLQQVDDDVFDDRVQPELLAEFLANPSNLLAVAIDDGTVIGMASAVVYVHPDKPRQLWINEVGVAAHGRRRGLGKRLVRALLDRGRALGCTEAWVATEEGNAPARAFYTSLQGREDAERAIVYTFPLRPVTAAAVPVSSDRPSTDDEPHGHSTLRVATRDDVAAIQRVRHSVRENRLTSGVITDEDVIDAIERTGRGWVVELDRRIVGFAVGNADTGNIWALFVEPGHEGCGHGRRLHDAMVDWLWSRGLQRLWLATEPNTRAQRFYEAAGWRNAGPLPSGEILFERHAP